MHTPPRAFLALAVATGLVAGTLPLPAPAGPSGVSGVSGVSTVSGARQSKAAPQSVLEQFSSDGQAPAGPGVDHTWGHVLTGSGQQVVNFVSVAPGAPGITIEAGLSNDTVVGLERSSALANRKSAEGHRALASINGDVWSGTSGGALGV